MQTEVDNINMVTAQKQDAIQKFPAESPLYVFDLNELSTQTDFPARFARKAIGAMLRPMIQDPERFSDIYHGVGEIVKDVEIHGSESDPRLVIVRRMLGEFIMDTVDTANTQENSVRFGFNGFGEQYTKGMLGGDDYSMTVEGRRHLGHLVIHTDDVVRPESATVRAA